MTDSSFPVSVRAEIVTSGALLYTPSGYYNTSILALRILIVCLHHSEISRSPLAPSRIQGYYRLHPICNPLTPPPKNLRIPSLIKII